jgi:methyl-accepting chemotaxis protein
MKEVLMKSIKLKMTIYLGILIIGVCIGLSYMSYLNASDALQDNLKILMPEIAKQTSSNISGRIEGQLKELEAIAARDDIKDSSIPLEEKLDTLRAENERIGSVRLGIADLDGNLLNTDGTTADDLQRDKFYQKALEGTGNVDDPIVTPEDLLVVPYAVPIKNGDEIIGVLVETRDGNYLSQLTNEVKVGSNGTAFMINKEQTSVADPDEKLVMDKYNGLEAAEKDPGLKKVAEIQTQMTNGETGMGEFEYSGIEKFIGYAPVQNTEWSVGITMTRDDALSVLGGLQTTAKNTSILFVLISLVLIYILSSIFSSAFKSTSKHLKYLAEGDLSQDTPSKYIKRKDEIGEMTRSMKAMQESLRSIIQGIKNNSSDINTQTEGLSTMIKEISSGSQNVSDMIVEIAQGTGQQSDNLIYITGVLEQFNENLSGMLNEIQLIDASSKEISKMATDSNKNMQDLNQSVVSTTGSFEAFFDKINLLCNSIKQISEITGLINSIAEQTNLLALNASIEAARAGNAGKGFSVIAGEVGRLAEQSRSSSENVSLISRQLLTEAESIVQNSSVMDGELHKQLSVIETSLASFNKIIGGVNQILPKIESVRTTAQSIDSDKEIIISKIQGVSSVSGEISASSESISASSEEISASIESVAMSANVLADATVQMLGEAERFTV